MANPITFVQQKNQAMKLANDVRNKERKVEIAFLKAKKAREIIR